MTDSFADAVARAKSLASRFAGSEPNLGAPVKRPASDDLGDSHTQSKRINVNDKVAQAAEIAARLAQKLGNSAPSQPFIPPVNAQNMNSATGPFGDSIGGSTVTFSVPDKYVGLIIGKKGEQISQIQADTSCRVQIAPDSAGTEERQVTLSGSDEQIDRAKGVLNDIISRADRTTTQFDPSNLPRGQSFIEIMVPGPKVGLIIGKSGETIKQLQEETGVKMVMIQESNVPSHVDKPLRITGDPSRLEKAREMVNELLNSKDMGFNSFDPNRGGGGGGGGGQGGGFQEVNVPRRAVGIVIGRGGEMLRKLSEETGARVQFRQEGQNDFDLPERVCQISGPPDAVREAADRVQQLVDNTLRGPGGAPGGPRMGGPGGEGPNGYGNDGRQTATYAVPAEKAGLVIGKGGETVKEIIRLSGAYVEIQKAPPPNPNIKVFNVSGSQQQVDSAIRAICERAGLPPPRGGAPGGGGGYGGYATQYPESYGQSQQQSPQWGQQTAGQWGGGAAASGMPQSGGQPSGAAQTPGMPAPAVNPSTGQADYSAAWAEYYRRQGMNDYADAIIRQAANGGGGAPTGAAPQAQPQPATSQPSQPPSNANGQAHNGAMGQPGGQGYDYQQWQQYNQQYQQWQQQYAGWQQQQGQTPPGGPSGPPSQQPPVSGR